MPSVFIITKDPAYAGKLKEELSMWGYTGFTAAAAGPSDQIIVRIIREVPQLIILEMNGRESDAILKEVTGAGRIQRKVPIITVIDKEGLERSGDYAGVDDFIVRPYDVRELALRARRLISAHTIQDEVLHYGALEINLANCEVRVKGKVIELTYKEYELLKFLAAGNGRVFSRDVLLNKVWGYDYFGGDRTVDVHIRRLRSKIEISGEVFIETVRNIGYRFTEKLLKP